MIVVSGDKLQDQDWQFLLGTEYHQLHLNDNVFRACEITPIPLYVSSSPCDELEFRGWNNKDIVTRLFSALHLVYENCKLNVLRRPDLALLADLNHRVASLMGWQAHADFYLRDFPHICSNTGNAMIPLGCCFLYKYIHTDDETQCRVNLQMMNLR